MIKEYKDVVIIGAGVAGLRAAISLEDTIDVAIIAKDNLSESSSEYAQGGIAVAISDEDKVSIHFEDTINAGDGLCDEEAVKILVEEGPARIQELIEWGTTFDKKGTKLAFTREGAHSRNRILHAHGDSTGKEIVRALLAKVKQIKNVEFFPKHFTLRLLLSDNNDVAGILCLDEQTKEVKTIYAKAVLLATGGSGRVYKETTNPPLATGDGISYGLNVGADLMDLEFVQFHPTTLFLKNAPRFLLSEALRGEGAYLVNIKGERFMHKYHPLKELAPRDVVSRAIINEIEAMQSSFVYLDVRHLAPEFLRKRFPTIYTSCKLYHINITKDLIPIHPAAHYFMGGVKTDVNGKTSITGLYAAGEVACTGVHGANRLASNSLLEGMVYGARAGEVIKQDLNTLSRPQTIEPQQISYNSIDQSYWNDCQNEIKSIAWEKIGIKRDENSLRDALRTLNGLDKIFPQEIIPDRLLSETRNIKNVVKLIAIFSLLRTESRGAHYRTDYPAKDDSNWRIHQVYNILTLDEVVSNLL